MRKAPIHLSARCTVEQKRFLERAALEAGQDKAARWYLAALLKSAEKILKEKAP